LHLVGLLYIIDLVCLQHEDKSALVVTVGKFTEI